MAKKPPANSGVMPMHKKLAMGQMPKEAKPLGKASGLGDGCALQSVWT